MSEEDAEDFNILPPEDESIIPASDSSYRPRAKGKAKFVSFRQYVLYVTRRLGSKNNWLWWGGKLAQQWLLSAYFKMFEERVSAAMRAQDALNLRSVLPEQLIEAYQRMLDKWAETSKTSVLSLF